MIKFFSSRYVEFLLIVAFFVTLTYNDIDVIDNPWLFVALVFLWFTYGLNQYTQGLFKFFED